MLELPEVIVINGKNFKLVKKRRSTAMAVYKFDKRYLRVGERKDLDAELKMRDKLKSYGFPVPDRFPRTRMQGKLYYYTERALGYKSFSEIFRNDIEETGEISKKSLNELIRVVKNFAEAQLKTQKKESYANFTNSLNMQALLRELPKEKNKIRKIYDEAKKRLSIFPMVLTHGDFNAHNLYRKGVIDFENLVYGPAGYDIISCLSTPDYFPVRGNYEILTSFRFSDEQREKFLKVFDKLYLQNGLPRLSDYVYYYDFCRAVWLTAKSHHIPKIQQFRYELFKKKFLR